ncbi:MAG: hypothetical protein VYE15_05025, partial [Myxococcota bacterium]|nr:hypothetical protein [Myxococcota bacterium]
IACFGNCDSDAVPACGDTICTEDETPQTCPEDCTGDPEEVQTEEEAITELNKCYEECMMVNGGQPPPGWPLLEICADEQGCLDMESITSILPPDENGEGGGTPTCGNQVCQWDAGEDAEMCPEDCEGKNPPECSDTIPCPPPSWCESGYCVCADGYECDGVCLDIQTSPEHCGECGNPCPANSVCNQGQCECAEETQPCGDTCADINWDENHCGSCFDACAPWMSCLAGLCSDNPPRPIAPLSGATVSSRRPLFQVDLPAGGESAFISVCADR